MQHERVWPASQPAGSENVGDVLASIRRLIAQDQSRQPSGAAALSPPFAAPMAARPPLARVAPAMPIPAAPATAAHSPFVLGRKDMVGDAGPGATPGQQQPHPAHRGGMTAAQDLDALARWRAEPLADWPQPGAPQALPMQTASPWQTTPGVDQTAAAAVPAVQDRDTGPALSPEEEAEFAEAEAALARMIAPRPADSALEPQTAFEPAALASAPQDLGQNAGLDLNLDLPHHTTSIEETPMAQDMRMMEMGRIDNYAAVPPNHAAAGGYDPLRGQAEAAPNLFGEIGAVAKDATMRMLIRDAIQQELHGELGARLSRNMCQMIRQEVEAVIREICAEQ